MKPRKKRAVARPKKPPLAITSPAVPSYQAAYKAIKAAMLLFGNARRDTTQIDAAVAQVRDALTKSEAFQAAHKEAI